MYREALILLAINIGYPTVGRKLLSELSSGASESSLVDFYNKVIPAPRTPIDPDDLEVAAFETVRKKLAAADVPVGLDAYTHWAPRVGRYSFDWNQPVLE